MVAPTEAHAAVLQQVTKVVEHGFLVLATDPAKVAQEAAAAGHHLREGDLLWGGTNCQSKTCTTGVILQTSLWY